MPERSAVYDRPPVCFPRDLETDIPVRTHLKADFEGRCRMRRMLPLLLVLVASQVPAVPGEGTLVSFCKQGRLTACQELAKVNPQKATELQAELAKAARSLEALRAAEEDARDREDAEADESSEATAESREEASN